MIIDIKMAREIILAIDDAHVEWEGTYDELKTKILEAFPELVAEEEAKWNRFSRRR